MKKIFSLFVAVLMLSSIVSSVIAQTISQPVTGSFILEDFLPFLQEKQTILFGNQGDVILQNNAVRSDFYVVDVSTYSSPVLSCDGTNCVVADDNLEGAYLSAFLSIGEESNLAEIAFGHMRDCDLALRDAYGGNSLTVGAQTYFNVVKLNYICMIKNLGILEQMIVDEPGAFFLLQMLQEIEVDYQHLLAIEDDKAAFAFSVGPATAAGGGGDAAVINPDYLLSAIPLGPTTIRYTITELGGFTVTTSPIVFQHFGSRQAGDDVVLGTYTGFPGTVDGTIGREDSIAAGVGWQAESGTIPTGTVLPIVFDYEAYTALPFLIEGANIYSGVGPNGDKNHLNDFILGDTAAGFITPPWALANPSPGSGSNTNIGWDSATIIGIPGTSTLRPAVAPGPTVFGDGIGCFNNALGEPVIFTSSELQVTTGTAFVSNAIAFFQATCFFWQGPLNNLDTFTATHAVLPAANIIGGAIGLAKADESSNDNTIVFSAAGKGYISSITGASVIFSEEGNNGAFGLIVAALVVVGLFVYILRKKP